MWSNKKGQTKNTGLGFKMPKRFVIILMASIATAIQYTIRSNLSVTIVAMVNKTELHPIDESKIDTMFNKTLEPKFIGCPVTDKFFNSTDNVKHELKGPKLHYSESTQGFVLGAFFYGYILTHVFAGQISSTFGPKKTIFYSLLLSSAFQLLTPYSTNFDAIFIITLRVLTGMAQGVMSPAIYTLFSNWVPVSERSTAFSFFTIGGYFGSIVTMFLSGFICEYYDWQLVFYLFGLLGLMFTVVWMFFVFDFPSTYPNITDEEKMKIFSSLDLSKDIIEQNTISYKLKNDANCTDLNEKEQHQITKTSDQSGARVPWLKLITSKDVWVVACAKFCASWSIILLMAKLPSYLDRILHMSMQKNSTVNAMIYICLCISAFTMGSLSDLIGKKKWISKLNSRKLFESIALFGTASCFLLIPLAGCDETLIVLLMILASVFYAGISGGDNVIVLDLSSTHSGSIYGLTNAIASTPGFLAPIITGFLLNIDESVQSWNYIFIISAFISLFGGIIFLLFASVEPLSLDVKKLFKTKLSIKVINDNNLA